MAKAESAEHQEPEIEISEGEDSLVIDRTPRDPSLARLGRYRVVREIASGGMATVNLAVIDGLDKLVALKVIHPHLASEESFVRMFLDEARIASSISHRNVCSVFDYGEEEGRYYMAMDFLAGKAFRDVIRQLRIRRATEDPLKLAVYLAYVISQACEGLHAAHELRDAHGELMNVVHRDVSPHNLFITYDGSVSVVDFGIARASDRLQQTATGILKGKFSYMAPEQVRQAEIDRRADIWALGVCLWEALTQKRMFVRSSQAETLMSVMMDPIAAPSAAVPGLPEELDRITMKAVARDLSDRYATAREMGRDLVAFCRGSGISVGPVELEQWIREMFPQDFKQTGELLRRAKKAASLGLDWNELTPSSAHWRSATMSGMVLRSGRLPTLSGVMLDPARAPDDARSTGVRPTSYGTAAAKPGKRGLLLSALGAAAAAAAAVVAATALLLPQSQRSAELARAPQAAVAPAQPNPAASAAQLAASRGAPAQPKPAAVAPPEEPEAPVQEAEEEVEAAEERDEGRLARRAARARMMAARSRSAPQAPARERASAASARAQARQQEVNEARDDLPEAERAADSQEPEGSAAAGTGNASASPKPATELASEATRPEADESAAAPAPKPAPKAAAKSAPSAPKKVEPAKPLAARIAFGNPDISGALGSGTVQRMLGRAEPLLEKCYRNSAQAAQRNDFSPVSVHFRIDEAGSVRSVRAGSHSLPSLSSCVAKALNRQRSDRRPDVGTAEVDVQVQFRSL